MIARLAIAAGCLLLGGCISATRLPPEKAITDLAELRHAGDALPSLTANVIVSRVRGPLGEPDRPVHVTVERKGLRNRQRAVVLVHGVLSDRKVWRFCSGALAREAEVFLVDLPGCGDSSKPDPAVVGEAFYGLEALANSLGAALEHTLGRPGAPPYLTLVGHSLGGGVVLRLLSSPDLRRRYPRLIERVDRAVLLCPLDIAVEKRYPEFEAIAELSDVEASLADTLGILARTVLKATYDGAADPDRTPREDAEHLIQILATAETRHAAQAMLRQAVPFRTNGRPDWEEITRLEARYADIRVPCLLVWGRRDESLPLSMGYKLQAQLPRAWLRICTAGTHFLPSEFPTVCTAEIRRFNRTGGTGYAPRSVIDERDAGTAAAADPAPGRPVAPGDTEAAAEGYRALIAQLAAAQQSAEASLNRNDLHAARSALERAEALDGEMLPAEASELRARLRALRRRLAATEAIREMERALGGMEWRRAGRALTAAVALRGTTAAPEARLIAAREALARHLTLTLDADAGIAMTFVLIPAGSFVMGDAEGQPNEQPRRVRLTRDYWIQTTELTRGQWDAVMAAPGTSARVDRMPRNAVSWADAQRFLARLAQRTDVPAIRWWRPTLPTEAEWERACRAGTSGRWSFGDDPAGLPQFGWYAANSGGRLHPAATSQPNGWGISDLHGNLWEWCSDRYTDHPAGALDPTGPPAGDTRVLRGGGFSSLAGDTRAARRNDAPPDKAMRVFGFRVVLRARGQ